jgi:SAM-dependent methyltransferase
MRLETTDAAKIPEIESDTSDELHPTACPICSCDSLETLHCFTANQAAEMFAPRRRHIGRHAALLRNIERLWNGPGCEIVQCNACRFGFPIPYVAGDKEFYELAYGVPSYPRHRWEYDRALEFLKLLEPSNSIRILELGAGLGAFIKVLLRNPQFSRDRILATDYSSYSVNELRKLGVDAQLASVLELAASLDNHASFDAVCAFQSIEHMADVAAVVITLKRMLKPAGLLILSAPHGPAIEFNERHLCCFDMPPNHVGRWYRESFDALAKRVGLELWAHEIEPRRIGLLKPMMEFCIRGVAASKPRSLAGWAQSTQNRSVRRALSAAVGSALLVPLLSKVFRFDCGYSQVAVLRKR